MELAKSQEMIVQLQNRLMEAQEQIATSKATELLLEDKKQQITELKNTIAKKDDEINKLHEDLETEMSKTWFQKLLGR
jgi:predicted RNase H-like nuclease (RuvC/YqgF family)